MKTDWTIFKNLLESSHSYYFYVDNINSYNLHMIILGQQIQCTIHRDYNPDDIIDFETNYKALGNNTGEVYTSDIIGIACQNRAQSVTTTAAEALGGDTILSKRKVLVITPTNGTVYWGGSPSLTTTNGSPIFKNQTISFSVSDGVHIYLIATSSVDCRIMEGS